MTKLARTSTPMILWCLLLMHFPCTSSHKVNRDPDSGTCESLPKVRKGFKAIQRHRIIRGASTNDYAELTASVAKAGAGTDTSTNKFTYGQQGNGLDLKEAQTPTATMVADASYNKKACKEAGNRVFDLRNGDATLEKCNAECLSTASCAVYSAVWKSWCIGCNDLSKFTLRNAATPNAVAVKLLMFGWAPPLFLRCLICVLFWAYLYEQWIYSNSIIRIMHYAQRVSL